MVTDKMIKLAETYTANNVEFNMLNDDANPNDRAEMIKMVRETFPELATNTDLVCRGLLKMLDTNIECLSHIMVDLEQELDKTYSLTSTPYIVGARDERIKTKEMWESKKDVLVRCRNILHAFTTINVNVLGNDDPTCQAGDPSKS